MEQVLDYEEAAATVSRYASQLREVDRKVERVKLSSALKRVLADPVFADRDQPPFPRSTRDGFACKANEANQHVPLKVIGQVRAGAHWEGALQPGEAIEIMTGAPVPSGADCVVMIEHVTQEEGMVQLLPSRQISVEDHIVMRGAEAKEGQTLIYEGTRLQAKELALAASCGYSELTVYAKPRVAILATGDELVEVGDLPLPHQIRNSNSYLLAAQIESAGAEAICLPTAKDTPESLRSAIQNLPPVDLLLLSGGVSAGKYDFVEEVLKEFGADFSFTGVRIQPGKPVVFGTFSPAEETKLPFFGLPGNPVSAMVTFSLFVLPILEAIEKVHNIVPRFTLAKLCDPLQTKPGLTRFLPSTFHHKTGEVHVIPWQGSGDIAAMARANCYIMAPSNCEEIPAGETVRILIA